ncbi:hypothetical protein QQ045_007046 [Rhodiola kirilowii]
MNSLTCCYPQNSLVRVPSSLLERRMLVFVAKRVCATPAAAMVAHPRKAASSKRSTNASDMDVPATTATITIPAMVGDPIGPKKVLVPIGFGTEEMEAVIIIDVLRRAGAEVTVASVELQLEVEASAGTKLAADVSILSCSGKSFDLVALPGGMPGSARLRDCEILKQITGKHAEERKLYGAICAAPAVTLQPWGLIKRKQVTGHPAFMDKLPTFWAVKSNLQVTGELTTSRGPGTAFLFAVSLVEQMFGESVAKEVGNSLLMHITDDTSRAVEFNKADWSTDHPPKVLVPVANGLEEIEVVTIVDILRRAKVEVIVASVEKSIKVSASQGTKIIADRLIVDVSESTYDLIILPGGVAGADRLHGSKILKKLLKEQEAGGRIYGASGSSPAILHKQGLLKNRKATAHPSVLTKLTNIVNKARVVIDGKVITSTGLATTTDFGLGIVGKLFGHARARSVAEGLVLEYPKSQS